MPAKTKSKKKTDEAAEDAVETGAQTNGTSPARKRALVTGASSGIGEEFARQLAGRGYNLVITARRKDRLDALAKELTHSRNIDVEVIEADLGSPEGVAVVAARIERGDIAMLVNNAGFPTSGQFADLPVGRELQEIDVNIRALTQLSHAAIGPMKAKGRGSIINLGSTGSYVPVPYMATYAATKAYILSFSEALHEEAREYGVTVTCLCPGGTTTEFQKVAGFSAERMPRMAFVGPESVVRSALDGARSGSAIVVPGLGNKATANLPRLLPRFAIRKLSGNVFKRLAGEKNE
ncbi:MAG: SDR family oxidoreductase [Dehalococcoidia bacterium]